MWSKQWLVAGCRLSLGASSWQGPDQCGISAIPCLHWFLPKSLLWNLQYSGMFSVTVESHSQGKQNQKFP